MNSMGQGGSDMSKGSFSGRRLPRRILFGLLLCAALLGAGYALAGTSVVTLTSTGPQPNNTTVAWGDTVNFSNAGTTAYDLKLAEDTTTQTVPAGGTYSRAFDGKVGSHRYSLTEGKKKYAGSIVVALTGTISLKSAEASVLYGQGTTLKGQSSLPTVPVVIQQRATTVKRKKGSGTNQTWVNVGQVTPAVDGSFNIHVRPSIGMRYRATTAGAQLSSDDVTVAVKPVVRSVVRPLALKVSTPTVARVRISPAAAAATAYLAVLSPGSKSWRSVSHVKIVGGKAALRWTPKRAGKYGLRVELQGSGLQPGYAASLSRATTVIVTWPPTNLALKAVPAKTKTSVSRTGSKRQRRVRNAAVRLTPGRARCHAGRVTLTLTNLDSHPHNIAIKGHGVDVKGKVVGKNGVSRVSATLKRGTYTYYSSVKGDTLRGELVVQA